MADIDWSKWTSETTPVFSLDGFETGARLLDVHDGDTVTVAAQVARGLGGGGPGSCGPHQLHLRLVGIDAPEMTSRDPRVRVRAEAARLRLVELLAPDLCGALGGRSHLTRGEMRALLQARVRTVFVRCGRMDKYGRVLAHVSAAVGGPHAGDVLVAEGLARAYDGGTKQAEEGSAAA